VRLCFSRQLWHRTRCQGRGIANLEGLFVSSNSSSNSRVKSSVNINKMKLLASLCLLCINSGNAFFTPKPSNSYIVNPASRDRLYGKDKIAQYLLDLNDAKATFTFPGSSVYQLHLSDALQDHLQQAVAGNVKAPQLLDMSHPLITKKGNKRIQDYAGGWSKADNVQLFHGREIVKVPLAKGGMQQVLQLCLAGDDPMDWSPEECDSYDAGYTDRRYRKWKSAEDYYNEGVPLAEIYGPDAYALHHRFYFHKDVNNCLILSAEQDGMKGVPTFNGLMNHGVR